MNSVGENMNCLAVDTTATQLIVALICGEKEYSVSIDIGRSGHSKTLMPEVDKVLKQANIKACDLDAVAVVVGPGSFTGIRIGVSAMTAIAYASGAKKIAVNSFELIAYNRAKLTASIEAGHGNLYLAECENGKVNSTNFLTADMVKQTDTSSFITKTSVDKDKALLEVVKQKLNNNNFIDVLEPFYMRKSQAERQAESKQ